MSSVADAAYRLVRDYPGGAVSLGPRMDKAASTLSHEVAGRPGYKLGLNDAVAMSVLADDRSILNAFADEMSCLVIPVVPAGEAGEEVMARLGRAAKEFGEFVAEVAKDTQCGRRVSANEMQKIEKEWSELVAVGQGLVAHVRAQHLAPRGVAKGGK